MSLLNNITSYLRSAREELKKVSWPSRKETIRFSTLVIGVSVTITAFFALLDFAFTETVSYGLRLKAEANLRASQVETQTETPVVTPTTSATKPTLDLNNVEPITTPTPNQ
ncbi:MAG: preprotein translocase subunit SecE [Patescibacteria group bacterium]